MKKPNFFIIGAPKCGTTSLADWLSKHPQVFMSPDKEPMFFNTDFGNQKTKSFPAYESLYKDARAEHFAVGEASTFYLNSKLAVEKILRYQPDAKFIVLLRKPQEMIVSLHSQACKGVENQYDFQKAWMLQENRYKGFDLPPFTKHPELFQYGERCKLGTQLTRLYDVAASDKIHVAFLEEIRVSPDIEFKKVLDFLSLHEWYPEVFSVKNKRVRIRAKWLKYSLNFLSEMKMRMGVKAPTGLLKNIHQLNRQRVSSPDIPECLESVLDRYFFEDIKKVEQIVGYVPSNWKG
jgi:hypothetical protein